MHDWVFKPVFNYNMVSQFGHKAWAICKGILYLKKNLKKL